MKNILRTGAMLFAAGILFTACTKTALAPAEEATTVKQQQEATVRFMKKYVTDRFGQPPANGDARVQNAPGGGEGSVFIIPFLSEETSGVGVFDPVNFTLELALFSGKMGTGDFYRRNPDGTVSVKINTQDAFALYSKNLFGSDPVLTGGGAHFSTTYTGPVKQEPVFDFDWNIIGYRDVVDMQNATRVIRMVGNGNVQDDANSGPIYTLIAQAVSTTSGQRSSFITLK